VDRPGALEIIAMAADNVNGRFSHDSCGLLCSKESFMTVDNSLVMGRIVFVRLCHY